MLRCLISISVLRWQIQLLINNRTCYLSHRRGLPIYIDNYEVFRSNRIGYHGDLTIYVRNDIDSEEISNDFSPILTSSGWEQIWPGIRVVNERILIVCIYRPP